MMQKWTHRVDDLRVERVGDIEHRLFVHIWQDTIVLVRRVCSPKRWHPGQRGHALNRTQQELIHLHILRSTEHAANV